MGKKHQAPAKKQTIKTYKPLVSVCTPTFNRRPFIPIMFDCFRNQTYPKDRIEWIIVDDGTDRIRDLVEQAQKTDIPQIKYFEVDRKMSLGEKRNYMHKHCKGSIIVYMDDDDYYPPERIEHAVDKLMNNKEALCAASCEMYVYFKHINTMYQCGPYGPNHATAGTFAFKSRILDDCAYEDHAALAEEKAFLKNYTVPFVQLDPLKTILVFSHNHNTFDKKKLLDNPHPDYLKPSPKTIDMFIQRENEKHIKKFFLEDIDAILEKYEPGHPRMKPDVLAQTKKIEEERNKQMREEMQKQGSTPVLSIQEPGKPPRQLTLDEVVKMLQGLQEENQALKIKIAELQIQMNNASMNSQYVTPVMPPSEDDEDKEMLQSIILNLQKRLNDAENKVRKYESLASSSSQNKESNATSSTSETNPQSSNESSTKNKSQPEIVIQV